MEANTLNDTLAERAKTDGDLIDFNGANEYSKKLCKERGYESLIILAISEIKEDA